MIEALFLAILGGMWFDIRNRLSKLEDRLADHLTEAWDGENRRRDGNGLIRTN